MINRRSRTNILAHKSADTLAPRHAELERIARHSAGKGGIAVTSPPLSGTSDLLRHTFDRLFAGPEEIVPFYFEFRESDLDPTAAAARFAREFLTQTVAYRRRDAGIIDASPEVCELAELAAPKDGHWIDRVVETCRTGSRLSDDASFVRNCLSAPLRAASFGSPSFVIIDNFHRLGATEAGEQLFVELREIFSRSSLPYVFAGRRRYMFAKTALDQVKIEPLATSDIAAYIENAARRSGVAINDQTRDLIAVQLGGTIGHIDSLIAGAAEKKADLNTYELVETAYTDEIFGGRTAKYFDDLFDRAIDGSEVREKTFALLSECLATEDGRLALAYLKRRTGLTTGELSRCLSVLNAAEVLSVGTGHIEMDRSARVAGDYIRARARLEVSAEPRALVVGEFLAENIRLAPLLMAREYRRNASAGLRDLIRAFDGQQISPALLDYGRFKNELKGAGEEKAVKALLEDNAKIALPQVVYAAQTEAFYPRFGEICDSERSAVAFGFVDAARKSEAIWMAVEVDSKLEATREAAEFWCDRLEMAALSCGLENVTYWLVAPEGFDDEAIEMLRRRGAFGSSRQQVKLLSQFLNVAAPRSGRSEGLDEYEITVPMGEDTEMLAVRTVDEIAKRHGFSTKAINQIKTATVEACINAVEHSLSPDGKLHLKFAADDQKLTVTITNRGVRLADKPAAGDQGSSERRGWGLKLIEGLMDSVSLDQTDDGTRMTMVKLRSAA